MTFTGIQGLDRSIDTTNRWIADVAEAFGTEDRRFAYRALRAWMHTLRDRLTVESAARLAAQLPELLRGVYYDGWSPGHVPRKYDLHEVTVHYAEQARIGRDDVPKTAAIVTEVVSSKMAPGGVEQALWKLPEELRKLFQPGGEPEERAAAHAGTRPSAHRAVM
ncbi:uncharacterized protein (DUF2267 family) [Actinomadura coerulea]|uniref:Uncharacterized protein (DUF2267 family) n=1 Tax=Actinomadura coerulea TaxID=46159 RepID=A0A7X0G2K6_9ACTN|nr:DUF2267 domain-containing protein [Actinomadura coerulea]MBB6398228.1 uncharacterized protein (DUF2267 family) [Actinomadura coerulea]GGQ11195.1 hypothetical protein GCM10010187_29410 [Actinomadura coerulea]